MGGGRHDGIHYRMLLSDTGTLGWPEKQRNTDQSPLMERISPLIFSLITLGLNYESGPGQDISLSPLSIILALSVVQSEGLDCKLIVRN